MEGEGGREEEEEVGARGPSEEIEKDMSEFLYFLSSSGVCVHFFFLFVLLPFVSLSFRGFCPPRPFFSCHLKERLVRGTFRSRCKSSFSAATRAWSYGRKDTYGHGPL